VLHVKPLHPCDLMPQTHLKFKNRNRFYKTIDETRGLVYDAPITDAMCIRQSLNYRTAHLSLLRVGFIPELWFFITRVPE
jgi:hypothetical protein